MSTLLVTGSAGLIGSEICTYFHGLGLEIHGIDNNQRAVFFGPSGDTTWVQTKLKTSLKRYTHHNNDVRDYESIKKIIKETKPNAIIHSAAQPSHDLAASIPFDDFSVNATGTLNVLEATRQYSPKSVFVHLSTNKVYGDSPNRIRLKELETRWDYDDPKFSDGIDENFSMDQSKHTLFGASKASADLMVQEYGRYFGMQTCCLRGGCLTGPNHSGVELHGFLSYLIKCNLEGKKYNIYGYKGKQVRDNIHSLDVARFVEGFIQNPRSAEVYNLGGGRNNSCSILEAFEKVEKITGKPMNREVFEKGRVGDHICYISNLSKCREHYRNWNITKNLDDIFQEIVDAWKEKLG